jgi:hypothetical protein
MGIATITKESNFLVREVKRQFRSRKGGNGEVTAQSVILRFKLEFSTNYFATETYPFHFAPL